MPKASAITSTGIFWNSQTEPEKEPIDLQEQLLRGGFGVGHGGPVEHGTWIACDSRSSRTWARRQQVRSLSQASSARFLCERKYQVKDDDGVWHSRDGFVSFNLVSQGELRIWAVETPQFLAEALFENGKGPAFTSKQRKTLNLAVEKIWQKPGIAEVFSPPRLSIEGAKQGFQSSGSFDLEAGWNLSDAVDRRAMWRHLQHTKPFLIILCPLCTMFSVLQELLPLLAGRHLRGVTSSMSTRMVRGRGWNPVSSAFRRSRGSSELS